MYKKGTLGQQITIFPFLFLMFIIGIGIIAGIGIFYDKGYDFRQAESSLLNYKLTSCILEKEINLDLFPQLLYEECGLNKEVIEKNNIIKICKNSQDCTTESNPLFLAGSNFESCLFEGAKENEAYPKCSINSFKKQSDAYQIITGSKQFARSNLA